MCEAEWMEVMELVEGDFGSLYTFFSRQLYYCSLFSHRVNVMNVLDSPIEKTRFRVPVESHTLTHTSILIISSLHVLTRHLRTVQPSETTVSPPHSYPNTLSALLSSLKSSF